MSAFSCYIVPTPIYLLCRHPSTLSSHRWKHRNRLSIFILVSYIYLGRFWESRKKSEYQGNFNRQTLAVQSQIHDSPMVISKGSNDKPTCKICRFLQCLFHGNRVISSFPNWKILNICPCCLGMLHYSLTGNDFRRLNNYSRDWMDCITNKPQHLDWAKDRVTTLPNSVTSDYFRCRSLIPQGRFIIVVVMSILKVHIKIEWTSINGLVSSRQQRI